MLPLISIQLPRIAELCKQHRVRSLWLIGSATDSSFDPVSSDRDFLVEFHQHERAGLRDVYFDLSESLEALFQRPIDLIEVGCVRNPTVLASIEHSKVPIYAAA